MKTKLFLLVGCLIAAMSLNAQTLDVQAVEKNERTVELSASQSSQSLTVYVWYDAGANVIRASIPTTLSCTLRIKGTINYLRPNGSNGQAQFYVRIESGSNSGFANLDNENGTGGGYPGSAWAIDLDEEPLQSCDGYTLIYDLERNGYNW